MSVKKMDEVPEKKTESKILAKMGKKEQGRCQKESVVLKNGQSTDNGKHVTVRVQRIRKIHIKQKLIVFSVLAVCLVVLAVFSDHLCPMILTPRIFPAPFRHPGFSIQWGQILMAGICCPG